MNVAIIYRVTEQHEDEAGYRDIGSERERMALLLPDEEQRSARAAEEEKKRAARPAPRRSETARPPKLTFKERKELEQLTAELDAINSEIASLEALFNSGEPIPDIAEKSARYTALRSSLDDKELRWLELSEKE